MFKGFDNAAYYRMRRTPAERACRYDDVTSTGNTLDARHPVVARLVLDSLRMWVEEYHVDGFRFDLAGALGRIHGGFDPTAPILNAIRDDPVVGRVKLIAEPWDAGPDGYAAGRFPAPWSEWNDRFRDTARRLWQGTLPSPAELGYRLMASRDRYDAPDRLPTASVNYVTAHDGFTLADVVAYDEKHNEANGEANHDGSGHEVSWNHGTEGPTEDRATNAARLRDRRNLLATLFLAQGVPMLLAGDELGRTQHGNNNAYCQDGEVSWLDWTPATTADGAAFLDFVRRLVALRAGHPALSRRHWVGGEASHLVAWFDHDGQPMTPGAWESGPVDGLAMRLGVEDLVDETGRTWPADPLLVLIHAAPDRHPFRLPAAPGRRAWRVVMDTAAADPFPVQGMALVPGDRVAVDGHSVLVLQGVGAGPAPRRPGLRAATAGPAPAG
jgi:glycogen operon protein